MTLTAENILLVGSILLFISIIVGKAGFRFGFPALLLFLGVGMLFGSDGLGIQFHNPSTAQFIGVIARRGVYRLTVDVYPLFGYDRRAAVLGIAESVENSAEHVF